jgi:hypothetical protein
MRLTVARCLFALGALLAACGPDYDGGGRLSELPEGDNGGTDGAGGTDGTGGTTGAGGFGLSGSSDSGVDTGSDVDIIQDCPVDAGYMIDTGAACTNAFPIGTECRRDDGAECVCLLETLAWDCR